jgi:hypothetical protein
LFIITWSKQSKRVPEEPLAINDNQNLL